MGATGTDVFLEELPSSEPRGRDSAPGGWGGKAAAGVLGLPWRGPVHRQGRAAWTQGGCQAAGDGLGRGRGCRELGSHGGQPAPGAGWLHPSPASCGEEPDCGGVWQVRAGASLASAPGAGGLGVWTMPPLARRPPAGLPRGRDQ